MKILIIAAGKAGRSPTADIAGEYLRRLPWPATVVEVTTAEHREREAVEKRMLAGRSTGATYLCLLDERGQQLSSREFADFFTKRIEDTIKEIRFIIGGAEGVSKLMRQQADFVLSLGHMTWPHLLVRAMLAEQIYRAATILQNHPYHRG